MRTAVLMGAVMVCGLAGCEDPTYVATFAPYRQTCSTWVGPSLCTVVLADEGEFNTLQRVNGLDWHWGETITFSYRERHVDTGGATDTFDIAYDLTDVQSIVSDPVGTRYALHQFGGAFTLDRAGTNLVINDYLNIPGQEPVACDPALCDAVVASATTEVVVELTGNPAVPLRVVSAN